MLARYCVDRGWLSRAGRFFMPSPARIGSIADDVSPASPAGIRRRNELDLAGIVEDRRRDRPAQIDVEAAPVAIAVRDRETEQSIAHRQPTKARPPHMSGPGSGSAIYPLLDERWFLFVRCLRGEVRSSRKL